MSYESRERVLWDRVALFALVAIAGGAFIWWLESRFGSLIAVMSLGLLAGALFFIAGALFAQRHTSIVLDNAADFVDRLTDAEKSRQAVAREYARMEREAAKVQLTAQTLDARRIDQIAQERARLLTQEPQSTWMVEEATEQQEQRRGSFRYHE